MAYCKQIEVVISKDKDKNEFLILFLLLLIMFYCVGKKSRGSNQTSPDNDSLVAVVKMRPEILQQMLQTVTIKTVIIWVITIHIPGVKYNNV